MSNLVLSFGWILLVLLAIVVMIRDERFREYGRTHPVEILFLIPDLWCLYTSNDPHWARGSFPRFAIPILAFIYQRSSVGYPKTSVFFGRSES